MPGSLAEVIAIAALVGVLAYAIRAGSGGSAFGEAIVAVPAAALLIGLGIVSPGGAWNEIAALGPTVAFLGAVLVLAHVCDSEGVFTALGGYLTRGSGIGSKRAQLLLMLVFGAASVITVVLSLDATVVLLTPVVLLTARSLRVRSDPHVFACAHLANSASLLLPVSNLTNLIVIGDSGLGFGRFTALMALPWLVVVGIEYGIFRRFFRRDLAPTEPAGSSGSDRPAIPWVAVAVVALTLAGFGVCSLLGAPPVWAAAAGAVALSAWSLAHRRVTVRAIGSSVNVAFLLFVLALGVVVRGVEAHGLGSLVRRAVPDGSTLGALALTAVVAAALACAVNNLPAILVLAPTLAMRHEPGLVLAALIGVNVGPNLIYVGSLATMLWRRVLAGRGEIASLTVLLRLGLVSVPLAMTGGVLALWLSLRVIGTG